MTIPAFQPTGQLTPGRHRCTLAEAKSHFVLNAVSDPSDLRTTLWAELERVIGLARLAVGSVAAVWIGGGFVTSKGDPSDIDVTFVIEQLAVLRGKKDPNAAAFLTLLASNGLGLKLDTFVIEWRVMPEIDRTSARGEKYFANRGHWDDFWQRRRHGPKGSSPARPDALPLNGYLEVIVDDYK